MLVSHVGLGLYCSCVSSNLKQNSTKHKNLHTSNIQQKGHETTCKEKVLFLFYEFSNTVRIKS